MEKLALAAPEFCGKLSSCRDEHSLRDSFSGQLTSFPSRFISDDETDSFLLFDDQTSFGAVT